MKINELIPLHNSIRNPKRVKEFEHRLRMGHILRGIETPIMISKVADRIETGGSCSSTYYKYYIHDGHHRIYAAWLCDIKELMSCEYVLQDMSYEMYQDLAPQHGWVTPLDIRTHVRKPDFYAFKNVALEWYKEGNEWENYIDNHQDEYLEKRVAYSVKDMIYAQ